MPRATRRALAEDAPSRSSPRASTRASTAAAASPSPAKSRGRRGKAEEPEPPAAVETKSRGRSSSRAKAAAVTPPTPPAGRQSRSKSKGSAARAKTTPTPPKRGRGKAKKEEEVEEEVEKEEEEDVEEEVAPKRGRAQRKTKSPSAAEKTTPPARASRGSRRSAETADKEEEEEPKKTTPRRSKGRSTPASTPPSRSRRGRGAGEPEEEKEEKAEEGQTDESGEAKKEGGGDSEMKEESDAADSEKKPEGEVPKEKEKEPEKMETSAEEIPGGQQVAKQTEDTAETEDKTEAMAPAEEKSTSPEADSKMETEAATEKKTEAEETCDKVVLSTDTPPEEKQKPKEPEIENDAGTPADKEVEDAAEADKAEADTARGEKNEPVSTGDTVEVETPAEETGKATEEDEKMEAQSSGEKENEEATPVAEEHMEEEAPAPAVQQPTEDAKNGDLEDSQPPRKPATKRKLEEEDVEEILDESQPKRIRVNGTDTDSTGGQAAPDVEMTESKPAAAEDEDEKDLLKDYEVVNKEELPPPDSAEVSAAIPAPVKESQSAEKSEVEKEEKMEEGGSGEPVTVVPLTEAEVAKVYGGEIQAMERGEADDVSSTIVEVGSVAGSDITGGLSRGLDVSELQSASNSVDGDDAADSSMNESSAVPETSSDFVSPAPLQETCDQPMAEVPEPSQPTSTSPVPDSTPTDSSVHDVTQTNSVTVANGSSAVPVVDQPPTSTDLPQNDTSAQQTTSSLPDAVPVQNSHPNPPLAKGSGSVTDSLGTPDPAFLAAYSSPEILNRAYVPNPAIPNDSVAPQNTFSVISYNILAECHRRRSEYKTPEEFLGQEYRHNLMMKELQYLNGDVVCLQEVDPDYFNNMLLPAMRTLGYEGLMKRRTQEYFYEGEATFYKSGVFELESSREVSLSETAHKEVEIGGLNAEVATAINKYLDRADVVLITRLRCKATSKVVTVGNIHVVYDHMKSTDVQCIQAACAIKEVVGMSGSDGAHIVCGDFNAEWSSPVYQLVLDGYLSDSSIHTLQGVQRLELNDGAKSLVNHLWRAFQHTSSNMKSAYSTVTKSEPEVTSYSSRMKTLDYMFYSASSLVPVGVLKTIDAPVISATEGLPTKDFPSDHLALKSVMAFCK